MQNLCYKIMIDYIFILYAFGNGNVENVFLYTWWNFNFFIMIKSKTVR
jgi:hypothetical protein